MGVYLNPAQETKEVFLKREGEKVSLDFAAKEYNLIRGQGMMPVVLVNNPHFSAAAVAYKQDEMIVFADINDHRPKQCYLVETEKLLKNLALPDLPFIKDYLTGDELQKL